jgi:hypothetical protein
MISNGNFLEEFQEFSCFSRSQIVTNCHKLSQIITNCHDCHDCHNCHKFPRLSQIVTNYHKLSQIVTNCHKLSQIVTNCQNCHILSQIVTNYHDCHKLSQIITIVTNCHDCHQLKQIITIVTIVTNCHDCHNWIVKTVTFVTIGLSKLPQLSKSNLLLLQNAIFRAIFFVMPLIAVSVILDNITFLKRVPRVQKPTTRTHCKFSV